MKAVKQPTPPRPCLPFEITFKVSGMGTAIWILPDRISTIFRELSIRERASRRDKTRQRILLLFLMLMHLLETPQDEMDLGKELDRSLNALANKFADARELSKSNISGHRII